jgi:hypothetical protein
MREGAAPKPTKAHQSPPKPTKEQKESSAMTTEEWNTYFSGHWNFAGAKQEGHLAYLTEKIKGKRIFPKYDKLKLHEENRLLCYLYLESKTFVNAHLIKSGLVGVDKGYEYRYRGKFLEMGELVQS